MDNKLLSARFWMAIMVTGTLCLSFMHIVRLYGQGVVDGKDLLAWSGTFTGIATLIANSYFQRPDRGISPVNLRPPPSPPAA